jgi:arylsulfatase A-like enzyme
MPTSASSSSSIPTSSTRPTSRPPSSTSFTTWQHDGVETPIADARRVERFRHRYAGEARFGDALFGACGPSSARLGLADRTLIVVTSDHGEEFGEHGGGAMRARSTTRCCTCR